MRHASLFSGIGGFDLAAEWVGWENMFHCEWNEFGQKILSYYWPKAKSYGDITKTDFTIWRGKIDILTGGFPCQPYSQAGKRLGKDDERHLWPEMLRAIQEIQPRWVVGENVLGLVNWNGGLVFDEVQSDLEAQGYEVQPFILPACAVNAPHRRDRVWFVAHSNLYGQHRRNGKYETNTSQGGKYTLNDFKPLGKSNTAHSLCERLQGGQNINKWEECDTKWGGDGIKLRTGSENNQPDTRCNFFNFPTQPPICGGNDGLPTELDGITFSKWRAESIKAYGNAIVPQVVCQIFKAINEYEKILH